MRRKNSIIFPQEFQCFYKIFPCHSDVTVRTFREVLHTLLSDIFVEAFLLTQVNQIGNIFQKFMSPI